MMTTNNPESNLLIYSSNYYGVQNEFNYVIKVAPQNHLSWLGLIEALTQMIKILCSNTIIIQEFHEFICLQASSTIFCPYAPLKK